MKELISRPELCDECGKCERICPKNAIRVVQGVPVFCLHCAEDRAPCMIVCPEGAIEKVEGAVVINEEACIGCGLCRDACPIAVSYTHLDVYKRQEVHTIDATGIALDVLGLSLIHI